MNLFEHVEILPKHIQSIIHDLNDALESEVDKYNVCDEYYQILNDYHGYSFSYGLDGVPYDLKVVPEAVDYKDIIENYNLRINDYVVGIEPCILISEYECHQAVGRIDGIVNFAVCYYTEEIESISRSQLDEIIDAYKLSREYKINLYTNAGVDLHTSEKNKYKSITINRLNYE